MIGSSEVNNYVMILQVDSMKSTYRGMIKNKLLNYFDTCGYMFWWIGLCMLYGFGHSD